MKTSVLIHNLFFAYFFSPVPYTSAHYTLRQQQQSQTSDITLANQQAQGLIRQADARNRQLIEQDNAELNRLWNELIKGLETRRDSLQSIAVRWDEFENHLHSWEKAISRLEDKFRNVDPVVRSRRHLEDTKNAIQVNVYYKF